MSRAVLSAYRSLLRARSVAFAGDAVALKESGSKIRAEFQKYRNEADPQRVRELLESAKAVETVLVENVLQARLVSQQQNTFRLNIRKDNALLENATTKFGKDGVVV